MLTHTHRRPLKTYSKRSTPSAPAEPLIKRRRIDGPTRDARQTELPLPRSSQQDTSSGQPSLPPPSQTTRNPKKGTILGYFKVVSPSSDSKLHSTEPSSCGADPPSTPPSSPPPRAGSKAKKRRRLRTRVIPPNLDLDRSEEDNGTDTPDPNTDEITQPLKEPPSPGILGDASWNDLNKTTAQSDPRSEAGKRGKRGMSAGAGPKSKPTATVQTTLSLSLSDTGFTECRDCNMLYNPYHEKDAKLHARRHAAFLKAKETARTRAQGQGGDDATTCNPTR